MEKNDKICEEILKECKGKNKDEVLIKTLINICKYYKINNIKKIKQYIANI